MQVPGEHIKIGLVFKWRGLYDTDDNSVHGWCINRNVGDGVADNKKIRRR